MIGSLVGPDSNPTELPMFPAECAPSRRQFLMRAAAFTTGASGLTLLPGPAFSEDSEINVIGPKKGYSPQIGTLVSMMAWMRSVVLRSVRGTSQKDLDYLFDANSNTIGSLLMHLAATDRIYQLITFEGISVKELPSSTKTNGASPWNSASRRAKRSRVMTSTTI